MLRAFIVQTKVLFSKIGFKIAFLTNLSYVLITFIYYALMSIGSDVSEFYHPAIVTALNSDALFVWFYMMLFPFLIVFPASFSYFTERKSGVINAFVMRIGFRSYFFCKIMSSMVVTFVAFFIPFIIGLLLNIVTFSNEGMAVLTNWEPFSQTYFNYANQYLYSDLFHTNPYLYYLLHVFIFASFASIVSVFVLLFSGVVKHYKIFLFMPFYLLTLITDRLQVVFSHIDFDTNYQFYILAYDSVMNKDYIFLIGLVVFIIFFSIPFAIYELHHRLIL